MAKREATVSAGELWAHLGSGFRILDQLGYDHVPGDHNPVWLALAAKNPFPPELIEEMVAAEQIKPEEAAMLTGAADKGAPLADKLSLWRGSTADKGAILTAYVLCQTAFLDIQNGPIRDGSLGTLRQRWYFSKSSDGMGFKLAAQALEGALIKTADVVLVDDERAHRRALKDGAKRVEYKINWSKADKKAMDADLGRSARVHTWPRKGWGRVYAQTHSGILADLVRAGMTYEQLWVRDASRDYVTATPLVPDLNGVLVLEKQGLFEHFTPIAKRLGFPVLLAMSGNNAFSGVESLLNDTFREWDGTSKVTDEHPLHIFSITDHDYYGLIPVEQGAVDQFTRYFGTENVVLHRVGITPEQVRKLGHSPFMMGYEILDPEYNKATWEWNQEHGLWIGEPGGADSRCLGMEVEALEPKEYIPGLIDAIVEACGGDEELRKALAKLAEPDWFQVRSRIELAQYAASRLYRLLRGLERWAEEKERAKVQQPINGFVHGRIDEATKWVCACGYESETDPEQLNYCPAGCGHHTYDAESTYVDGGGWVYFCPCGHKYDDDPDDEMRCPECNESLSYATASDPWKEAEHVQEAIEEILEKHAEAIEFDGMAENAETGYGVWRPATSEQATNAAVELFEKDYERTLGSLVDLIDNGAEDLIDDLEAAYRDLSDWALIDPDD